MVITLVTVLRKTIVFWMQLMLVLSMEIKRTWTWKNIADNECNYCVCLTWLFCGWFHQVHNLLLYLRQSTTLKKRVRVWWRNAHYTHTHNCLILNERVIALCIDFQDTNSSSFYFSRRLRTILSSYPFWKNELLLSPRNITSYNSVSCKIHLNSKRHKTVTACKKYNRILIVVYNIKHS